VSVRLVVLPVALVFGLASPSRWMPVSTTPFSRLR